MENNVGNGESSRRRFVGKLAKLAAAAGIGGVILAQLKEKGGISPAQAVAPIIIDANPGGGNVGVGTTWLDSNTPVGGTFVARNTVAGQGLLGITENLGLPPPQPMGVYGLANTGIGVQGDSVYGYGVQGFATGGSGTIAGVHGVTGSTGGYGVLGYASTGHAEGVKGQTDADNGIGVHGIATTSTGSQAGVYGESYSDQGKGVWGVAQNASGSATGVYATTASISGFGVYGYATNLSGRTRGVYGISASINGTGVEGSANSPGGVNYGVHGNSFSSSGIGVLGEAADPGAKPIVAQGTTGQTASLQEWQDQFGNPLSVVDKVGQLGVGVSAPVAPLHLYYNTPTMLKAEADGSTPCILSLDTYAAGSTTSGAGFVGRHSRGTKASPTDVAVGDRLGFNIFGGYAGGAFRHVAGIEGVVDTGTVSGSSLPSAIRFLTTPDGSMSRQERMRIDANGNIIPPTDNSGSIGTASKRWSNLYVVTLHQGDIVFENGVRATEEGKGLAFLNDAGEKIAVLDRQGNWHIKGTILHDL